ncbi:MAG: glycosylase [Planctomyces sp.]
MRFTFRTVASISVRITFLLAILSVTITPAAAAGEFPDAIVRFRQLQEKPVFEARPGHWDAKIRERGWILKEGETWKLWYTGYDPAQQPPMMKLGYATSADGISWTRYREEPLIDSFWVEDMMIVHHGDQYLMFAEGAGDQAQLLTSPDGISWTRTGTLDVRLQNGEKIPPGPYGTPVAFFENGVWNLFYERSDTGIWLARSTDLKVWTNVSDKPVIVPGPDTYDALMIAMNQVLQIDGRYYAVLHGTGTPQKPRQWCTFVASSDDLIHWKKYSGNPLLPIPDNRSSGQLVRDGAGFRLYTMHDRVDVHLPD